MNSEKKVYFPGVKDGETFMVGDMELIKFPDMGSVTPVVMRDIAFHSRFGEGNNLKESNVLRRMEKEILPKIIEAVGAENLCTIKTDLDTLDGLNPYGEMESLISLPTLDFYRKNASIFDKHKVNRWWWLATPDSAAPHDDPLYSLCVSPSGFIGYFHYGGFSGVRPFLLFVSSIFGSSEQ